MPPPTLAAAMCDPALVYRDGGAYEVEGGLKAFRTLLEQRVLQDPDENYESVDKMANIMSALSAMRSHSGELFSRPDMRRLAAKDLTGFWHWAGTDPNAKLLQDVMAVPLLSVCGSSSDVEPMHKKCNIIKGLYSNRRTEHNVLRMLQLQCMWAAEREEATTETNVFDSVAHNYLCAKRTHKRKIAELEQTHLVLQVANNTNVIGSLNGGSSVVRPEKMAMLLDLAKEHVSHPNAGSLEELLGVDAWSDDEEEHSGNESEDHIQFDDNDATMRIPGGSSRADARVPVIY